jgi:hypothetical protein
VLVSPLTMVSALSFVSLTPFNPGDHRHLGEYCMVRRIPGSVALSPGQNKKCRSLNTIPEAKEAFRIPPILHRGDK